ncbi:MAG: DUF2306 domain-containing protein [Lysobacterales bacterium]
MSAVNPASITMGRAPGSPLRVLHGGAIAWFVAALLSQWLFAAYIVAAYGMPLAAGTPEAMNRTHPITGHVPGDHLGNTVLLFHLLPAIWLNLAGLLQLVPRLRQRYPILHRINGRVFLILALSGALSGLLLTWVRGSRLSDIGALGTTLNGILIVLAVVLTWRLARLRQFAAHRRWAIRCYLLVSGVWMFRLGYTAWLTLNQGPFGNTRQMDGPFDLFWSVACYGLPLAIAEIYFRSERASGTRQWLVGGLLGLCALFTLTGTATAYWILWRPHF